MTLGNKLRDLRKDNNMTQENLADYLDVSRQSISKWESDETYPETDKLIILSDLFKVSLDYLLKDNNNEISKAKEVRLDVDMSEFKKQHNFSALMIATGTFILLNGVSLMILLRDILENEVIPFVGLVIPLIVSIGLFIFFGMKLGEISEVEYDKTKDFMINKKTEQKRFVIAVTLATVFLLCSVFSMIIIYLLNLDGGDTKMMWPTSLLISGVSISVFIYVFVGIRVSKFKDKEEVKEKEEENHIVGVLALLATAVYLIAGFVFDMWGEAWIVYPVFILIGVAIKKIIHKK